MCSILADLPSDTSFPAGGLVLHCTADLWCHSRNVKLTHCQDFFGPRGSTGWCRAAHFPFFPDTEETKDTAVGKTHMRPPAISVCPYSFLGLWAPKHKLKLSWGCTCSNHRSARKSASTCCIYLRDKAGTECWETWPLLSLSIFDSQSPSIRQLAGSNQLQLLLGPSVCLDPLIVRTAVCGRPFQSILFYTNQSRPSRYRYRLIQISFQRVPACSLV